MIHFSAACSADLLTFNKGLIPNSLVWQIRWGNNKPTVALVSQIPYLKTQRYIAWLQIGVQL